MTIVTVRAHALESDVKVTVEPGSAVLLGRQPDERTLRKQAPSFVPGEVAAVSIPCPQVSKNHALIRATGAAVSIQDLWSTHGTWLRLLPGVPVTMEAPAAIELELARAPVDPGDPKDSEWSQPADFPEVVREAVERWLDDADVIATAAIGAGDPEEGDAWAFALADGSHLKRCSTPSGGTCIARTRFFSKSRGTGRTSSSRPPRSAARIARSRRPRRAASASCSSAPRGPARRSWPRATTFTLDRPVPLYP
jgi:hypothetical protein